TKDGETFPVEVTANFVDFEGQELNCAFARDISERKRTEEALRAAEEQLRQAQKMEAIGQLAGGIAHDFNNLLMAILGYADLVLGAPEEELSPNLRDDVQEIKAAAERASALTRQILAFSRRQALQPEVLSLNTLLLDMERLLRRTLGEDIELITSLAPDLGLVEVDARQFEQVVMNLAVNARDAMPQGGRLTLETSNVELDETYSRTHPVVQPGSYVMLAVSDTGIGMDAEVREHIFEPFFTTKKAGEGTGLGLSTVYGIVKQSGGSIFVYSEPGKGATFKIYLPRVECLPQSEPNHAEEQIQMARGGETVLVVDDEEAVCQLVARVLERLGYEVLTARTGPEALALLADRKQRVDLLLTDVVLGGGMQANDLVREARAARPNLRVLFMSGYTRNAIVHAGRLDPGVNYLEKPFTPEILACRVREVLEGGGAA
ncbi:MAG: response regulator, partial [Thermoleophilia bacterium]|nr:response regulator [Thermoleophilia bacterium]